MTKQQFHIKLHFYLAMLIAFCFPIARLVPVFISLMLLNWLIEGDFKNKFQLIIKNKFTLLFVAFYVLHLIGLLYTQNMKAGLFDIEVKLSILLFPIILTSRPMDSDEIKKIFFALITGCAIAISIMLFRATYIYLTLGENHFYYEAFASFLIHPSYISMYMNVAIAWLLLNVLNKKFSRFFNILACVIVMFFSCMIVLLSSKMGLITMIIIYSAFLIYYVVTEKKYVFGAICVLVIGVSIYAVLRFVPELSGRIDRAFEAVTSANTNKADAESTAVRMLVWKAANQVISENMILGTGTGDAKDELIKEYNKRGMTGAVEHKLNAHNEYYQIFVALGIIGFITLLANLFFPMWQAFKTNSIFYMLFLLIISLNFLTESMLETQAGVMFYAFFNSLLCFQLNQTTNNQQPTTNN